MQEWLLVHHNAQLEELGLYLPLACLPTMFKNIRRDKRLEGIIFNLRKIKLKPLSSLTTGSRNAPNSDDISHLRAKYPSR